MGFFSSPHRNLGIIKQLFDFLAFMLHNIGTKWHKILFGSRHFFVKKNQV